MAITSSNQKVLDKQMQYFVDQYYGSYCNVAIGIEPNVYYGNANVIPVTPVTYEQVELYQDYKSRKVRTTHQDQEIEKLKQKLEEKKTTEERNLKDLIAYYYVKNN